MRVIFVFGMLAISMATSERVFADQLTVDDIYSICTGSAADVQAACKTYLVGAFEGISLAGGSELKNGQFVLRTQEKQFCVPDNLPSSAMRELVLNRISADLKKFPEDKKLPAISFIAAIIVKTYRCN